VGPPVEYGNGLWIFLDITATPNNAETLQLWVEAQDPVSGKWAPVANFPTILASSLGATPPFATFLYHLYPGAVETVAQAQQDVQSLAVPPVWRARVAHSGGGSWTYTLSAIEKNI